MTFESGNAPILDKRHVLTPEERLRGLQAAHTLEAQARARQARALNAKLRREDVRRLRARGLVVAAIADELGMTDRTVRAHLRALRLA